MTENASPFVNFDPLSIAPERLAAVLQESGWKLAGRRGNVYIRLTPPEGGSSVLVPLDRTAPDYSEAMQAALGHIARLTARDSMLSNLPAKLVVQPTDTFLFRAETAAPTGLIPWTQGEKLIQSSRRIMLAGAKSYLGQFRYFGNKFGQFANRYLDSVLMGQTAPGSYIVTAFTPANGVVTVTNSRSDDPLFDVASDVAPMRSIGISVMNAAEATKEAVSHYRSSGSLAGFDDLVSRGVSFEMTTALTQLVSESDGADISVEWDPALGLPVEAPTTRIELTPADAEVLTRASAQLAVNAEPPSEVTVMGRVHLLTQREAGGPGVIGIENLSTNRPKKLRVHLNEEDYHAALRAHDANRVIVIRGRMEREGNIYWIYRGRLTEVLGSVDEIKGAVEDLSTENIPGQMEFDTDESLF